MEKGNEMLHRFNKFFRLLVVLLLISPVRVYADETTVTEGFDNQELNEDITFVYGGNDTAVSAETDCDNSQAPGSINIEDMVTIGNKSKEGEAIEDIASAYHIKLKTGCFLRKDEQQKKENMMIK